MAEGGGGGNDVSDLLSQFRCLGTTDREILINELHSILGGQVPRDQCIFVLEMSSWNLQNAIGVYYDYLTNPIASRSMRVEGGYINPPGPITTGKQFVNIWIACNNGSDQWPTGTRLVYSNGYRFNGIIEGPIDPIKPNHRLNISVTIVAPSVPGIYKSNWRLCDNNGRYFGDVLCLIIKVIEIGGVSDITNQLSSMTTSHVEPVVDPVDGQLPHMPPEDQLPSYQMAYDQLPSDQYTQPSPNPSIITHQSNTIDSLRTPNDNSDNI